MDFNCINQSFISQLITQIKHLTGYLLLHGLPVTYRVIKSA